MRFFLFILFLVFSPMTLAQVNVERHDLQFEYGLAYHTLRARQEKNETQGRLTSPQYPYWVAAYTLRTGDKTALRFFGGVQLVRFDEPPGRKTVSETQTLVQYGLEGIQKLGPIMKLGLFAMKQDHPLYLNLQPNEYEIFRASFAQAGAHVSFSQRRRVGLLWGIGFKGYALLPTKGGNIVTEVGGGGEGYARLGWVGPLGTLYQLKGFYQASAAPNALVSFVHENLGYSFNVQYSF